MNEVNELIEIYKVLDDFLKYIEKEKLDTENLKKGGVS